MKDTNDLRAVMDISLTALVLVDDERRYVSANEPAASLFGTPLSDLLTRRVDDFVPPAWRPTFDQLWPVLLGSGRAEGHGAIVRPDGRQVSVEYRALLNFRPEQHLFALRDAQGDVSASTARRVRHVAAGKALTVRQRQILQLAAGGCSSAEIADILFLSPGTVKTHFQNIYKKLDVGDRASAVASAMRHGMIF
jgi:DNA-binding CsgD family transcriptional regulator